MRKLLLFFLLASASWPQAQPPSTYQPQMISFNGVPFGPCDIYQFALNNTNGNYYSCQIATRTWTLIGGANTTIQTYTVATLPASAPTNTIAAVTDGNGSNCSSGGGALRELCQWNGSSWVIIGGGITANISGGGTPNTVTKFTAPTVIGNSSITDDGTNPTRAVFGINSASAGDYDEWIVDTGGVTANKLACRSASTAAKVVICPAGATTTVIGVAQATVAVGGTVQICWAAKCNVISSNATTVNDWLIPSATVPGDVDDTGSAVPPTAKTFAWPAETAVSGGAAVQITTQSLDTLIAAATGGNLPNCLQYSGVYESAAGTGATYGCLNPQTANGQYVLTENVVSSAAVAPTLVLPGVLPNAQTGTTYTYLYSDRAGYTTFNNASPVAVTLPQAGTAGFTQTWVNRSCNIGAGTATITPTTSTISYTTGNSYTSGASSLPLTTGQCATIFSNNTNYFANIQGGGKVNHGISFSIGIPGGAALSPGSTTTDYITIPFACTINAYNLAIDAGTITVKFWKIATGTAIPTVSNSISTSGVSISSGTAIHSTTLSDFTTTAVAANDIMAMNVTAAATATFINGVLSCQE